MDLKSAGIGILLLWALNTAGAAAESLPSNEALEAAGAVIGRVIINPGNIFDTSIEAENYALPRLANRLHIRTRPETIEARLLFHQGDVYSARKLAESERLLRDTRYLHDAQIKPVAWHDGVVDVEVRTQDVWTLNPGLSFGRSGGESSSGFELEELNLLGLGTQLSLGYKSGVDRDSQTFLFRDRQMAGSWWGFAAQAQNNSDGRVYALNLERPFFSLDTQWASGLSARNDERIDSRYNLGDIVDQYAVRQQSASLYGGWSRGLAQGWTRRWTLGVTLDDSEFERLPAASLGSFVPPSRKLIYPWVGYERVEDRFIETRNRDQIARTEDFQLGWHLRGKLGFASPAFGSDRKALMFESSAEKGMDLSDRQTLLLSTSFSGRMESGELADAIASVATRYYLRQSEHRLLFFGFRVESTSALDPDRQLLLGGDSGLRGYPLRYQAGEGHWLFTAEQRWFTDWYPMRLFNVGGAVFFDAGRSWGANPWGTPSQGVLKDIGFGLRLGNSRSALGNVLHLDVAVPLDGDRSIEKVQFLVETRRTF